MVVVSFEDWEKLKEIEFEFVNNYTGNYKKIQCNNLSAFDIEVSNGYQNPTTGICEKFNHDIANNDIKLKRQGKKAYYETVEKVAIMYIWQYAIESNNEDIYVFLGRTWEQFIDFTNTLTDIVTVRYISPQVDFSDTETIIDILRIKTPQISFLTYVHNLSYEFQFLRNVWSAEMSKKGKYPAVFAREKRHPMKFAVKVHKIRMEFRDSYVLSGMSLKNWTAGKSISKLEESADFYEPILTPITPLSQERIQYSINDVACMIVALREYKEEYYNIFDIPLTQTGIIRKKAIATCQKNRRWIEHCFLVNFNMEFSFYLDLCDIFAGGWTHANSVYSDRLLKDVSCFDLASSYPAIMCTRSFPIGEFEQVAEYEYDDLLAQNLYDTELKYHYWLEFECETVHTKTYNTFWSSSKCVILEGEILDNGKIYSADKVRIKMTDLDFEVFRQAYTYDNMHIIRMYKSESGYLPKELIELLLEEYGNKTSLKPIDEKNADPVELVKYNHAKVFVNGIYGCEVYKSFSDDITFSEDWGVIIKTEDDFNTTYKDDIEKHQYKQWTMYQIGVWVTAWGRSGCIWKMLLTKAGDHLIDERTAYGDTDSIKGLYDDDDLKNIDNFNQYILGLHEYMANKYNLDINLFRPCTPAGKCKPLGIFAPDGNYDLFKTLGAKRYCYEENGKIHTTIAGLKKSKGAEKITELGGVEYFNRHLEWTTKESEKLASHYLDNQPHTVWIDDNGERYESDDKYGICLQPIPFDLGKSKATEDYEALIALVAGDINNPLYFEPHNAFYQKHVLGLDG